MAKKRTPDSSRSSKEAIKRREALKRLGALAITAPTLASIACDEDPEAADTGTIQNNAEAGVPSGGPGGTLDAGGGAAGGGTQGGGTQGGGTQGGGTQGGGTQGGGTTGGSSGGTPGGGAGDAGTGSAMEAGAGDAGASSAGFLPPNFATAPTCTVTPTDPAGEGPFFIHEIEAMTDPSIVRVDMREGKPGVELQINLRLLDTEDMCMTPIKDVEVYVWHTDALGWYSGFLGQNPDQAYMGGPTTPGNDERFCRGVQVTDANGVVSFRSIFPGWYTGRAIHIHFVALRKGSGPSTTATDPSSYRSTKNHIFTTQFYFPAEFSRMIHENNAPYNTRSKGAGYEDSLMPDTAVLPQARLEGNIVVASLNILTGAKASRGAGAGGAIGGLLGGLIGG